MYTIRLSKYPIQSLPNQSISSFMTHSLLLTTHTNTHAPGPITPSQSRHPYTHHLSFSLFLFRSLATIGTGAASCLPTTHPFSPTSLSQHDHLNPPANSSYSISVHASPSTSGSKFSQTMWEGLTSRLPALRSIEEVLVFGTEMMLMEMVESYLDDARKAP